MNRTTRVFWKLILRHGRKGNAMTDFPTRLLSPREMAERLGVGKTTLLQWVREGLVPCVRIRSNLLRFDPQAVVAALKTKEAPHVK